VSATLALRVPAEFAGQARVLRDAIAAEDQAAGELIRALGARVKARLRRGNAIPRVDTIVGVADEWQRNLPQRGRLLLEVDLNKRRKALTIRELRLTGSVFQPLAWASAERGLILNLTVLQAQPFLCQLQMYTLAHVGLHALARRLQRGADVSEDAIKRDLRLLGQAHRDLADRPDGSAFAVAVPGGAWRGDVQLVHDPHVGYDRALAVRTFMVDGV